MRMFNTSAFNQHPTVTFIFSNVEERIRRIVKILPPQYRFFLSKDSRLKSQIFPKQWSDPKPLRLKIIEQFN